MSSALDRLRRAAIAALGVTSTLSQRLRHIIDGQSRSIMAQTLELFMWGYQPHFRVSVEHAAQRAFRSLGAELPLRVQLVGVRRPGSEDPRAVCLEPNDGDPGLAAFDAIHDAVVKICAGHEGHQVLYGDAIRAAEKPARIRADAVRRAVQAAMDAYDVARDALSVVATPVVVGEYEVCIVLTVPRIGYGELPQLTRSSIALGPHEDVHVVRGLPDAAIDVLLEEGRRQLEGPEPGRYFWDLDPDEVLRRAGRRVLSDIAGRIGNARAVGGLFDNLNAISVLNYEGAAGSGSLILAPNDPTAVEIALRFRQPVPLNEARWARKALQMSTHALCAASNGEEVYALADFARHRYDAKDETVFHVVFDGPHRWDLLHGAVRLMEVRQGIPRVPRPKVDVGWFKSNLSRVVKGADVDAIWQIVEAAMRQRHGTMIVVSAAAADEAERLANQATPIEPRPLDAELVERVTGIDGAVIVDPRGVCHALGVILDGVACPEGTPSRGARYNSALRYVAGTRGMIETLAVIVSEDGYVDVHPSLRRRISRSGLVNLFERASECRASGDEAGLRQCLRAMDILRFYLDQHQCDLANEIADLLKERTLASRAIWVEVPEFVPDPEMTDEYLE